MYQKKYTNTKCTHIEYAIGDKVLLPTKNMRLHGTSKFRDSFAGPFVVTELIGNTTFHLDLLQHAALRDVHNICHVWLLYGWLRNGVHTDVPPIKIDGEAGYKVAYIKGHCEH